jgi:hypothetical protein
MKSGVNNFKDSPESKQAHEEFSKNVNKVVKHLFDSSYVRP